MERHRYCLEIYGEKDHSTPGQVIYSEHPFLAISVGDLINRRAFPDWTAEGEGLLQATKLEHIAFGMDKDTYHKICIYTRYVPDTMETRRS